jgi:hypothetical protein
MDTMRVVRSKITFRQCCYLLVGEAIAEVRPELVPIERLGPYS